MSHRPQMHLIWCRLHKEHSPWSFIVLIEQKQVKLRRVTALEPSNFYCAFTIINQKDNREKSMSRTGMIRQRNSIFPSRRVLAVLDITLIDTTDLSSWAVAIVVAVWTEASTSTDIGYRLWWWLDGTSGTKKGQSEMLWLIRSLL